MFEWNEDWGEEEQEKQKEEHWLLTTMKQTGALSLSLLMLKIANKMADTAATKFNLVLAAALSDENVKVGNSNNSVTIPISTTSSSQSFETILARY